MSNYDDHLDRWHDDTPIDDPYTDTAAMAPIPGQLSLEDAYDEWFDAGLAAVLNGA